MRDRMAFALLAACVATFTASAAPALNFASTPKPLFRTLPNNLRWHPLPPAGSPQLTQWNGSFTDHLGQTINYTMPGTDPATSNASTTFPVVIVPIKMVY